MASRSPSSPSRGAGKLVRWRRARRVVQALALLAALAAVLYATHPASPGLDAGDLLRLDPLAGLTAMLAARQWLGRFLPGLALLGLAVIGGRFWCGWLCPVGTLLDWVAPRSSRPRPKHDARWRRAKYGLLFVTLFAALWGNLTLLLLDPLTLWIRSLATVVLPSLHWLIVQAETALFRISWLAGPLTRIDNALQGTLLSYKQPHYGGVLLLAAALGGVLALNLLAPRAWCRYLCPLGGLYGLVSKASWLKRKVEPTCVHCDRCARQCPLGAIEAAQGYASDSGECTLCLDCGTDCPTGAIFFGADWRLDGGWAYDPDRRQVLGALGASLAGVALLKTGRAQHQPHPHRLRPPGAEEAHLLAACVRCGACLRACPSHGLQPSLTESGLEGLWTPILVPRLGPCEYGCHACGQVCPSGAIPRLSLAEKRMTPIGKAYIDPVLCLAWSGRAPCIVCEEMCPLPEKAIVLEERVIEHEASQPVTLQAPVVLHQRCIGCGLCESKCPIQGQAAIRVVVDPLG